MWQFIKYLNIIHAVPITFLARVSACVSVRGWLLVENSSRIIGPLYGESTGHRSFHRRTPFTNVFLLLSWTSCWARRRVRDESPLTLMWHHCNCRSVVLIWLFSIIRRALQFSIVNQVCVANNSIACLFKISCWPRPLGGAANCLPEITNGLLGRWGQWG